MVGRRIKAVGRRAADRVLAPHLQAQTDQIDRLLAERLTVPPPAPPTPVEPDPVLVDFDHLLHELRTVELRRLPVDGGTLLSAGCAGAWYFEWLETCAGPFERHIGVELYTERPDGLAPNVEWIASSASHMPTVGDGTVDVVYSGQNLEHLWIDDMVGFLTEAARVLRPGGRLVMDSPNRLAVEALGWSHPEHTVELTADEAVAVLEAAGFDVEVVRGLWRCRDDRTGRWLALQPAASDVREILDRSAGRIELDSAFVWWIEARRSAATVDTEALRALVAARFAEHWPTRVNRGAQRPATGPVVYRTLVLPLLAGPFRVRASHPELTVRVLRADGSTLVEGPGAAEGTLADAEFGVTVELVATGPATDPGAVRVDIDVTSPGATPA